MQRGFKTALQKQIHDIDTDRSNMRCDHENPIILIVSSSILVSYLFYIYFKIISQQLWPELQRGYSKILILSRQPSPSRKDSSYWKQMSYVCQWCSHIPKNLWRIFVATLFFLLCSGCSHKTWSKLLIAQRHSILCLSDGVNTRWIFVLK